MLSIFRKTHIIVLAILLASCNSPIASPTPTHQAFAPFILVTQDPNASSTPTPFQPSGAVETSLPTFTPSPPATATFTDTPPPTQTEAPPLPSPTPASSAQASPPPAASNRTSYILYTTLDFKGRTAFVDQTIRYYNKTGGSLADLVLSVQPNSYRNGFILNSIALNGAPVTAYALEGQRLTISLPQALTSGSAATLTLSFKLNIPSKGANDVYGYDFNQINLTDWYPFVVPYRGGWILHDPMPWGEHLVYEASDVELNIKTDSDITLAVGASPESNGEWTRYRMYGTRTLALSASSEFMVSETSTGNITVRSYYFNGYQSAGDAMANTGASAIQTFSSQYAPYPHQTLAIVQTDMDDGQEYDGLVFLSTDFYAQYGGGARNNLTVIGVHEIAHQWWFSLVGNDQALEPWLDEALSTYSERIFFENNYPANVSWWWQFRVNYFNPTGYVDTDIYNGGTFRSYTNAVYFQGAYFLDEMRMLMGYGNFSKFIKEYARRYSYGHATAADFFALARETINVNYDGLIEKYFWGSY